MKKSIFILAMLFATQIQGQLKIVRHQDEMTDKVYYYPNEGIVVKSEDGESGFRVHLSIKEEKSVLIPNDIVIKAVNIGSCYENNKLTFLFENGEKVTLGSWNKFNCEGNAYFEIPKKDLELFKSQKLMKMRFENGRTYDSLTGEVDDKEYFTTLFNLMNQNKYETE
jgi:hypothetical protein